METATHKSEVIFKAVKYHSNIGETFVLIIKLDKIIIDILV